MYYAVYMYVTYVASIVGRLRKPTTPHTNTSLLVFGMTDTTDTRMVVFQCAAGSKKDEMNQEPFNHSRRKP